MKFKDYLEKLNKIAKDIPESLDYAVVYSIDEEGNSFKNVEFNPSTGVFEEDESSFIATTKKRNAICIN